MGLRPWELAAGIILVLDALEELAGWEKAGKEVVIIYPGLTFLAGVIYLLDRRALKSQTRTATAIALTVVGVLSYYHRFGFIPTAPIGDVFGAISAIYLVFLWWNARRRAGAAVAWVFGIGFGLLLDSLGRLSGYDLRLLVVAVPLATGVLCLLEAPANSEHMYAKSPP